MKEFKLSRSEVVAAIEDERAYQKRKWGQRTESGEFVEASGDDWDFLLYADVHAHRAADRLAGSNTADECLVELRKVVALAVAALAFVPKDCVHVSCSDGSHIYSDEAISSWLKHLQGKKYGVAWYVIRIQSYFDDLRSAGTNGLFANIWREIVAVGLCCFMKFGVPFRDLSAPVVNFRDGLPA